MMAQFYFPASLGELFSTWSHFPDAVLYAGGTQLFYGQTGLGLKLPEAIISLARIDELKKISRTERYLEIGSMVCLNDIINLGKVLPAVLRETLLHIANPQVRNLATLGGNICSSQYRFDTNCPLAALDAEYGLQSAISARSVSAARFTAPQGLMLNDHEILTKLKIPLEGWDFTAIKKFNPQNTGSPQSGLIAFLGRMQKNILSEARLTFSGQLLLRDKNLESSLSGKQLPLENRDISVFVEAWDGLLEGLKFPDNILRTRILNFIISTLSSLKST
jgi:CO/xanthine dehydrogenase FAD-binding subunit